MPVYLHCREHSHLIPYDCKTRRYRFEIGERFAGRQRQQRQRDLDDRLIAIPVVDIIRVMLTVRGQRA